MTAWHDRISTWDTTELESLDPALALLTRVDRKYILAPETLDAALADIAPMTVVTAASLREQRYASRYFDTPDLAHFRAAAYGRPRRHKIRTREYLDTGDAAVELKVRSASGVTVKHRTWIPDASQLGREAQAFLVGFPEAARTVDSLVSVLTTEYARTTLTSGGDRVTIDRDVVARGAGGELDYGDIVILETKAASRAGELDLALWALHARPARISKYATSLAALNPHLPSNRWARTIRLHLTQNDAADIPWSAVPRRNARGLQEGVSAA